MYKVISNDKLGPNVHRLVVSAPRVAKARRAGQFVIVRKEEGAERIPLTIGDADPQAGTITLFIQAVGAGTKRIVATPAGESLRDVAGPLGLPTHLEKWGNVACIGGGVGTAVLYPLAKALAEEGNKVYTVIGARSAEQVILADELAEFSEKVFIATEDGSEGRKGLVTVVLEEMLSGDLPRPDAVFAVGPVPMMAAVAEMTRLRQGFGGQARQAAIPTIVSLNAIMIDGTGMCGGCRVTVGGETKFTCVDGPEFDAHQVDFDGLRNRLGMYREQEAAALKECKLAKQLDEIEEAE